MNSVLRTVMANGQGLGQLGALTIASQAAARQSRSDWGAARAGWLRAIAWAERSTGRHGDTLARYRLHLAMCEFFLDHKAEAAENLRLAETSSPVVKALPEAMLLHARLMRAKDPEGARSVLLKALDQVPNDTPILYEICSVSLDHPNPSAGLSYARRLVALGPNDLSFRRVSADLHLKCGDWETARREAEAMVAIDPASPQGHVALLKVFEAHGDVKGARQLAIQARKANPGGLLVWHHLIDIYIRAGRLRHARLICRFLIRQWPHSRWHRLKYAEMLAMDGELNAADRELARCEGATLSEPDYAETLWTVARQAGARHEALARLDRLRTAIPFDLGLELAYAYALADVKGPVEATQHFHAVSIRAQFHRRTLHGLAHMAVRERMPAATLSAWKRAAEVHPDDALALAEYSRALFETGQGDAAIALCTAQLDRFDHDQGFVEFYVWLSTAVGRFRDTLEFCVNNLSRFPNSWQLLESGMTCAVFLGEVEAFAGRLLGRPFQVAYERDVQRLYSVMRVASIVGKEDVLFGKFNVGYTEKHNHPWLMRLDDAAPTSPSPADGPRVSERLYQGTRFASTVGQASVAEFQAMSAEGIGEILTRAGRGSRTIHIFSRFEQTRGGSELHALDLAERLRPYAKVELWAPTMCHSAFIESGTVRVIDPWHGDLPAPGGIVVLIGLYFDLGPWMAQVAPFRVIALYNTFEATLAVSRLDAVARWTGLRTDLLYCAHLMERELGLPGVFEPSPTDLDLFHPVPAPGTAFTLGRHSRDVIEKHHPEDARVYRAVAALGGRSVLLGGVSMRETFGPVEELDLKPSTSKGIPEFLQSLHCYYYRTGTWVEPWGRVVIEAMACGLPVVAHRLGGYAEAIEDGRTGFLFDETDEAIERISRLMGDRDLRNRMGREARAAAERLVGPEAMRRLAAFYLFEPSTLETV